PGDDLLPVTPAGQVRVYDDPVPLGVQVLISPATCVRAPVRAPAQQVAPRDGGAIEDQVERMATAPAGRAGAGVDLERVIGVVGPQVAVHLDVVRAGGQSVEGNLLAVAGPLGAAQLRATGIVQPQVEVALRLLKADGHGTAAAPRLIGREAE